MSVSSVIKSIQDIMRKDAGVDGDAQRVGQLGWMPEHLRWRNWAADPEGITGDALLTIINDDLFRKLRELTSHTGQSPRGFVVQSVFEDAYNYMKNGTLIRQVINTIEEDVDFNKSGDRHLFNDIYEKILSDLQSAGNASEYYPPAPSPNSWSTYSIPSSVKPSSTQPAAPAFSPAPLST